MKKSSAVITHTEIVCLAIKALQDDIQRAEETFGGCEEGKKYVEKIKADIEPKIDALRAIYRIETGTDYV